MGSHGAWSNQGQNAPAPSAVRVLVKILVIAVLIVVPLLFINASESRAQGAEANETAIQQGVVFHRQSS